jgi:hypothetical protein
MMNLKAKTGTELIVFIVGIVLFVGALALISSYLSIISINILFGTTIATDMPQIFALAWLQITVGGLIRQAKSDTK